MITPHHSPIFSQWWHDHQPIAWPAVNRETIPPPPLDLPSLAAYTDCAIFPTSGSTGSPKWVILSRNAILHSARHVNECLHATKADSWLLAIPERHIGGFSILVRAALREIPVFFHQTNWNPHSFSNFARDCAATLTSLVPTQIHDLVSATISCPPSIRAVLVGGAALSRDTHRKAIDLGWPIMTTYGMTETSSQVATQSLFANDSNEKRPLNLLPHWTAKILPDDRLAVKGPALASAYLAFKDGLWQESPVADNEGWFVTGDLAQLSGPDHRDLTIIGRFDERIKILGEWLDLGWWQQAIEEISPHLAIAALPDARSGHSLWMIADQNCQESQKKAGHAFLAAHLPPFARPCGVITIPKIPRSSLGKLQRNSLTNLLAESSTQAKFNL